MPKPYSYVPATVPEVREYVGAMVIAIPDLVDSIANGGIDGAYASLQEGLDLVRKRLGEPLYLQLSEMARASHAHFAAGERKQGRIVLQHMDEAMKRRRQPN
jgi:hypothetical protein